LNDGKSGSADLTRVLITALLVAHIVFLQRSVDAGDHVAYPFE
jgi:hypothetical protein